MDILRYLLLSTLIWGVLVMAYPRFSRTGSYHQRRMYLLLSLLGGALLPLVHWSSADLPAFVVTLPEVVSFAPTGHAGGSGLSWNWTDLLLSVYVAGLVLRLLQAAEGMIRLVRICRQASRVTYQGETVHLLPHPVVPFHVLGHLYFPDHMMDRPGEFHMAFLHERAHRQSGHGIDLVVTNLMRILFWFQPILPLFVRELRLIHEFQADHQVIHQLERDTYARFIGSFRSLPFNHPVIHTLNHSPLKQRIMQMYNRPTSWNRIHVILLLTLSSLLVSTTAFRGITLTPHSGMETTSLIDSIPDTHPPATTGTSGEVLSLTEVMPRFPGCEDQGLTGVELDRCAQRKMLEYVYTHLKYPEEAIKKEVEGTSIASFVVEKDGSISNIHIIRDIGGGTGEATASVLQQMQEDGIRWIPGEQDGQKVRVEFKLPIKFKLTDPDPATKTKKRQKR